MAWSKGQSGNPKGRAAEKPFADALRMEIKATGSNQKQLRVIARKLLEKAADGDMQAISCVADRLDGKPLQQMEVATDAQPFAVIPQQLDSAAEWEAAQKPRTRPETDKAKH
ncbi:DUF5681 domain-containing protein [Methyloceanibacter sp.]|uniref:DUF5681 domain-containing protein n=1 Tax=Methyloceanibacter sp. TaxID=1965321 RepID=UPI00351AE66B